VVSGGPKPHTPESGLKTRGRERAGEKL
jgi:hypothetical protein